MRILGAVLAIGIISVVQASQNAVSVRVGEPRHRVVEQADPDGDIRVSIQVPVENLGDQAAEVVIELRAVDADGFEVFDDKLYGRIPIGEVIVLSDWQYVGEAVFKTTARLETEIISATKSAKFSDDESIVYGRIDSKVMNPKFREGEVKFALKLRVQNVGTEDVYVSVTLEAHDAEGFLVDDVDLKATLKPGETKELTDSGVLQTPAFESIRAWTIR